jgi:hypothetical protein
MSETKAVKWDLYPKELADKLQALQDAKKARLAEVFNNIPTVESSAEFIRARYEESPDHD